MLPLTHQSNPGNNSTGFQFKVRTTKLIKGLFKGRKLMMKKLFPFIFCSLFAQAGHAAELGGVFVEDEITVENGEKLILNGIGLREKFWVDVYVGSLYLPEKTSNVADILSSQKAWRIQMDFVYEEVDKEKLVTAWREGFNMNQEKEVIQAISERMNQFYAFFSENAVEKDQFIIDYIPAKGATVSKNRKVLGTIPGTDFKKALLEIWLGNFPADDALKRGMLGL